MAIAYGSVCSGIEAASVAWSPLGWQCRFVSEIDKFPCAVLKHRFPSVPNYGDMTKYTEWPDEQIDVLVGGTPCQPFSVAGLRRGLADPRGNLALVYLRVLAKYRPRWIVWENVPGVLSSDGGRDFGAFLGALGQLGYGLAYRVLDAQHFGVPQRRRRVFVVGHSGDWRRPAAVLFERESLSRYPTEGRKDRESASPVSDSGAEARTVALRGREGGATAELGGTVATTLRASQGGGDKPYVLTDRVRRLSPVECERLQGFPDDWTKVMATTKDGPRYKAIGNSMPVPVMRWIGEGIAAVSSLSP